MFKLLGYSWALYWGRWRTTVSFVEERQWTPQSILVTEENIQTYFRVLGCFVLLFFVLLCSHSFIFEGEGVRNYNLWNSWAFSQKLRWLPFLVGSILICWIFGITEFIAVKRFNCLHSGQTMNLIKGIAKWLEYIIEKIVRRGSYQFLRTFQGQTSLQRKGLSKTTKALMRLKKTVGVFDSGCEWEIQIEVCC